MSSISAFFKKNNLLLSLVYILLAFITSINFQISRDYTFSMVFSLVFWLVVSAITLITRFPVKVFDKLDNKKLLLALVYSISVTIFYVITNNNSDKILGFVSPLLMFLLSLWFYYSVCAEITQNFKKRFIYSIFIVTALTFIVVIYLPFDSFISNITNFEFTCSYFSLILIKVFIVSTIGLSLLLNSLKPKYFWYIYKGLVSLCIAIFVQYMFLNRHLSFLGVANDNSSNLQITLLNLIIWIAVFVLLCYVLPKFIKNNWINVYRIISIVVLGYHVVALVVLLVLAPSQAFKIEKEYYFDNSGQFTLSSNQNVIVFVFDAYDNRQLLDVIQKDSSYLDGLEDFTVYTNTASVFDSTVTSLNQMFGGCEFDNTLEACEWFENGWNSEVTTSFYEGMHSNNYICNAYNFELPYQDFAFGKFDNLKKYDNPESVKLVYFNESKFFYDFEQLALYRIAPYLIKNYISFEKDAFAFYSAYPISDECISSNQEYYESMDYQFVDENIFMVNHLDGIHSPCVVEDEVENCSKIMKSLIEQLKVSGLYDSSTIIFMSDHGKHNEDKVAGWEWGCTPIFIIKEPGNSFEDTKFSSAPISTIDIMGTIAVNVGLSKAESMGSSIYDFEENSSRIRFFYDRVLDPQLPSVYTKGKLSFVLNANAYAKYVIEGDSSEIYDVDPFENGNEILPMKEYFG